MADIELVIKIPEDIYKGIMAHNRERREGGKSAYYFEGLIQNGTPLDEVLDKIRAEFESQRKEVSNKNTEDDELQAYYHGLNDGLKDARDYIDKYKVESEVQDAETTNR